MEQQQARAKGKKHPTAALPLAVRVDGAWVPIKSRRLREWAGLIADLEYEAARPQDRADTGRYPCGVMLNGVQCSLADASNVLGAAQRKLRERKGQATNG